MLEVGGRELAMMTRDNGVSCLMISTENWHLYVVKALLEANNRNRRSHPPGQRTMEPAASTTVRRKGIWMW